MKILEVLKKEGLNPKTTLYLKNFLVKNGYIPLYKSWFNRMGFLDLIHNQDDIIKILRLYEDELPDDLKSLLKALTAWRAGKKEIYVGESATLYRFLKYLAWKTGKEKKFILQGTLRKRKIYNNKRKIINASLNELSKSGIDKGTTQWRSAAILYGNTEEIKGSIPPKIKLTYQAIRHWNKKRSKGECWDIRYDEPILNQAIAFLELLSTGKTSFKPETGEDYPFARIFRLITEEEGKILWPQLEGHETNRFKEVEEVINIINKRGIIISKDHRVVQAAEMYLSFKGIEIDILYSDCVNKSWPQFRKFLKASKYL